MTTTISKVSLVLDNAFLSDNPGPGALFTLESAVTVALEETPGLGTLDEIVRCLLTNRCPEALVGKYQSFFDAVQGILDNHGIDSDCGDAERAYSESESESED